VIRFDSDLVRAIRSGRVTPAILGEACLAPYDSGSNGRSTEVDIDIP
jgi:hypothetical protein